MISRYLPVCNLLLLAMASVGLHAVTMQSELRLRWSFDEGEGSIAGNQIGTGLDVILHPGVSWGHESNGTAKSGFALDLSAGTSRGSVMHDIRLQANDHFTYMFWFKTNGMPDDFSQILSKRKETYSSYFVQFDQGGESLKTIFRKYGSYYDTGPIAFSPNQWHFLAAVHDGEMISTYLDGRLVYEIQQEDPIFIEEGQLGIGGTADGGSLFSGWVDDLRFYDKALSFKDIKISWGDGFGDFGPQPDFSGVQRATTEMPMSVNFSFRNSSGIKIPTTGIDASDIITSGGTISNFIKANESDYSFDLNATQYPQRIRISLPAGAGRDDQNITTSESSVFIIYGDIVTQSEDLVGWWTFDTDESNSTHAFDSSGGDLPATLKGSALISAPPAGEALLGGALQLDGIKDYVEIPVIRSLPSSNITRYEDLELWWPLDGSLADASGNGRHATASGETIWGQGHFGEALIFSGNDFIFAENYKGITGADARYLSLWINTLNPTTQTLAYWGTPYSGQAWWVKLKQNLVTIDFDGPQKQATTSNLNLGVWNHIAIGMPSGGNNRTQAVIFINGEESLNKLLGANSTVSTVPSEDFRIGNNWENAEYFSGLIDDIRLYKTALRSFDIKQIYNAGTTGPEDLGEESFTISLWAKPQSLSPAMEYDFATAWYEGNGGEYMEARVGQGRVNEADFNDLITISPQSKKQKENFPEGVTLRVFDGWFNDSHLSDIDGFGIYPGEIKTKSQGLPDIPNLTLWLDAADEATITTSSGNEVTTWTNKLDSSIKMHSTYKPNTGAEINGLNALDFDKRAQNQVEYMKAMKNGSTNWTPATSDGVISGKVQNLTLFIVARIDTLRRTRMPFGFGWGDHLPWNNGQVFWKHDSGRHNFSLSGTGKAFLLTMLYSKNMGKQSAFLNGHLKHDYSRTNDDGVGNLGVFIWPDNNSGGGMSSTGYGADWTTGEILVTQGTISNSLRQDTEGYLAYKWGLVDQLPSDHPYSGYGRIKANEDALFSVQTSLPSVLPTTDSLLWEMGDNTTGAYLGFKSGFLRLRAGSNEVLSAGQNPTVSDLVVLDIAHDDLVSAGFADDKVHELKWEIQVGQGIGSPGKVKLWIDNTLMGESSAGTILGNGQWAQINQDNGGFTMGSGEVCANESNTSWPYPILPPMHYINGNGFRINNSFIYEDPSETFNTAIQVTGNTINTLTDGLTGTDSMGAIWFGKIAIANEGFLHSGEITFGTQSDDGSAFWVDLDRDGDFSRGGKKGDELVVSNLGSHGQLKRVGTVFLGYKSPFIMRAGAGKYPGVFMGTEGLSTSSHFTDDGDHVIVGSTQLNQNDWSHLVMVVDREKGEVLHYLNGKLVGENSFTEELWGSSYKSNWFIGGFAGLDYFDGWVDDLRLYSKPLSDDAISLIYNWGSGDMGVSGKIEAPSVTDDNPIDVTLKFYQFGNLVSVSGLSFEEVNLGITGGIVVPASFTPSGIDASTYTFSIIPDDEAAEVKINIPANAASYLSEATLPVNYTIKIIPNVRGKENLLHWWWFDEAVAKTTVDGIGGTAGILHGDSSWSADALSQTSIYFQNIGDIATLGTLDSNFSEGEFALSFWFRRTEESFSWSPNLISNVMVSLGDENGSVLEIGSKGNSIDLFLATEIKTQEVTINGNIRDDRWHFISISYDENASDQRELKVYLDGVLVGSTSEFGGKLKAKDHHQWLLGSSNENDPSLGRFIGKVDDFRVYNLEGGADLHNSTYNDGHSDLSLTIETEYDAIIYQNPITANFTFKKYGQDCSVDFNASYIESENTGPITVSGSGAHWALEFNSTVNPGRITINILESAGVDVTGLASKSKSFQFGFGRPIVALDRLSAWWTFDEASGNQVFDYFGKFQGTFKGNGDETVTFDPTQAKFGSSLYFPQNAWVNTDAYASELGIDSNNERTISLWMHTLDHEHSGGNVYQPGVYGIGRRYSYDGSDHGLWSIRGFWDQSSYRRFFSSHSSHDPQVYVPGGVKNKWVHVAHQYKGNTILVYVDGVLRLSSNRKGIETQNYFPLQIGRWTEQSSSTMTYKGWIDDFRVYDAALSETEVQQIYGGGDGDFNIFTELEIESIVDGDPTQGRIRFTRNQQTISDLDFNLSNDLLMTGGFIEPNSLQWDETDRSYTFDYTVDPTQADPDVIQYLSPKLFPGLTLWLDANDSATILEGVDTWRDKSGNNRHATYSLGSPVYNPTGIDGLPAIEIRRSSGNDALSVGGSAFFAKEHYYVFRSATPEKFDYYGGVLGHQGLSGYPSSRESNYLFQNSETSFHGNKYPTSVSQNGSNIIGESFTLSSVDSLMVLRIEVNDNALGPYTNYRIGTTNDGNNYCTSTDIGEILAFESSLSLENREKLEGYLAHKWGIEASLPNSHPYSSTAPSSWTPNDVSPSVWFDANDSSTIDLVPHWLDKSNAGRVAAARGSPVLNPTANNGLPAMSYSGNGQYHEFGDITNIRTIFWVWEDDGGSYFMLGDNDKYNFHRGSFLFNSNYTSAYVKEGLLKLNGTQVFTTATNPPSTMSIFSLRTTGNVEASNFSSDRSIGGRYAQGDLAELLVYNTALDNSQMSNIEYYLNVKWGLGHQIASSPMIFLGANQVLDAFGQGNDLVYAETRKMHRAVTRGNDLLAWWPMDNDSLGSSTVIGKSLNERTANLYDVEVTSFGKFGRGLHFDREQTDARLRINDNGVDIESSWTLSAWIKNITPPAPSGLSTLFRGQDRQADLDFDRYLVIRGADGILHSYDGADVTASNRFRSTEHLINPVSLSGWHLFTLVGKDSKTLFYIDGKMVGDSDRKEQSDIFYVGNSSDNELFAEYIDDIRIYGTDLTGIEVSQIYGGGFGDQFPSILIEDNSTKDDNPRLFKIQTGKDNKLVNLTDFDSSDWSVSNGVILDMNSTGTTGEYILSVDFNDSEGVTLKAPYDSGRDENGKPLEEFHEIIFAHELAYGEEYLLSRWSFEEANGSVIRDCGPAKNHAFLKGNAHLNTGKFGQAIHLDGNGDFLSIPHFKGLRNEGNFTLSAWVKLNDIGIDNNINDAGIFCTDIIEGNTAWLWYDVNNANVASRSYSFNLGQTSIEANQLDAPGGLALEDRWQHVTAVMKGQYRLLYINGVLVAQNIGSNNIVSLEGSNVRLGAASHTDDFDFDGSLDEVRLYNCSFTENEVAILYGNGNGDLGIVPTLTTDSKNGAPSFTAELSFYRLGQKVNVSNFDASDINIDGGTLSDFTPDGLTFTFTITPTTYSSRISLSIDEGAANVGQLLSSSVNEYIHHHRSLVAEDDLALWFTFDGDAVPQIMDLSTNNADGSLHNSGGVSHVPGKFGQSVELQETDYVKVSSDVFGLQSNFTLSLWAKVLDDTVGTLVSNGQLSLQYGDDTSIRAKVATNNGWAETKSDFPSGEWAHYVVSYDNTYLRLFINGTLTSETAHSGYLTWEDGGDHFLYINRSSTLGLEARAAYDEIRIYKRALLASEISDLWSNGTGDLGLSPLISGLSPFYQVPVTHEASFREGNLTRSVSGLSVADLNVTGNAVIQNFDSTDLTYDLSVSSVDDRVRVSIAAGAVEYEGNLSAPGAFEFHRRQITSVEDGLLAWYRFDEVNRTSVYDSSGRMRNGKILSQDATKPGEGNLTYSPNFYSPFDASKAFDDIDDEPEGRWLPKQSDLNTPDKVFIRYDFGESKTISSYKIVSQHWLETERSPKAWVLEGSLDDSNWITVDEENDQTEWGKWEPRTFEVDNPSSFRFYKLTISEAVGDETYWEYLKLNSLHKLRPRQVFLVMQLI